MEIVLDILLGIYTVARTLLIVLIIVSILFPGKIPQWWRRLREYMRD